MLDCIFWASLIRVGNFSDVLRHYAMHKLFDKEGLSSDYYTKQLVKHIQVIHPDIVQLHNIHDHWLNYKILFKFLAEQKMPVVWTQHDCWSFTGGCTYFDLLDCHDWKNGCVVCPDKRSLFKHSERNFKIKEETLSKLNHLTFVTVSDWLGELMRHSIQCKRNIITIHNGVDINVFKPIEDHKKSAIDGIFRIIGVAAVWNERKGLNDFIRLRSLLSKEQYEIVLIGLTKKQVLSLPDGIKGIPRTDSMEDLARLYANSDVYVNLTYSDNFPTTNIEALASGTPVITYDTGGSPEAVDKNTGIIIGKGNVEKVAQHIMQLKEHPFTSAKCRERAEMLFDKNKCYNKYMDLYESLL